MCTFRPMSEVLPSASRQSKVESRTFERLSACGRQPKRPVHEGVEAVVSGTVVVPVVPGEDQPTFAAVGGEPLGRDLGEVGDVLAFPEGVVVDESPRAPRSRSFVEAKLAAAVPGRLDDVEWGIDGVGNLV